MQEWRGATSLLILSPKSTNPINLNEIPTTREDLHSYCYLCTGTINIVSNNWQLKVLNNFITISSTKWIYHNPTNLWLQAPWLDVITAITISSIMKISPKFESKLTIDASSQKLLTTKKIDHTHKSNQEADMTVFITLTTKPTSSHLPPLSTVTTSTHSHMYTISRASTTTFTKYTTNLQSILRRNSPSCDWSTSSIRRQWIAILSRTVFPKSKQARMLADWCIRQQNRRQRYWSARQRSSRGKCGTWVLCEPLLFPLCHRWGTPNQKCRRIEQTLQHRWSKEQC